MGSGTLSSSTFRSYASKTVGKSTDEVFTSRRLDSSLDPKGVKIRESRDSSDNPESTAIIVGIDVTGSMGMIADNLAREGLTTICEEFLKRRPVKYPHFMFNAIGDVACDSSPLQVSQFEADARMIEQLNKIYIEKGGGGNDSESYNLSWYFAGMHTSIDCFEKRGKKGYLFTIGDEDPPYDIPVSAFKEVLGTDVASSWSARQCLEAAEKMYHVFHIIIAEGSHCQSRGVDNVRHKWAEFMGQRAVVLKDYTKLSELLISLIQMFEGTDKDSVIKSWDGSISIVIAEAVKDLSSESVKIEGGVVTL